MQYNRFERLLSRLLSEFPTIKESIKLLYQKINFLLYKKKYNYHCQYEIKEITIENQESFFGYYDKSPINKGNNAVLFNTTSYSTKNLPSCNNTITLIIKDMKSELINKVDDIKAYNWQQGCKCMWLNDNEIIYNNYDESKSDYVSKSYNILTGKYIIYDIPIYDTFNNEFALTLNFSRLHLLRPDYGYRCSSIKWTNLCKNDHLDGVFYLDLKTGQSNLIFSIEDAKKIAPKENMTSAQHKFNHIMISPSGEKFIFIHRWFVNGKKTDRLLLFEIKTKKLSLISDDEMVSHSYWISDNKIISYLRDLDQGDNYYIIDLESKEKHLINDINNIGLGDGHPSIHDNMIVFDTYPDKSRMKGLFTYNLENKILKKIGEFYEPFDFYGETRCDLHPRFSHDGKKILIDSVHTGKRHLYEIII